MSENFEPCTLEEATHVELNNKLYELGYQYELGYGYTSEQYVLKYNDYCIEVRRKTAGWHLIHVDMFPILGIKPLREKKPEPIEFEATFAEVDNGYWHPLYSKVSLSDESLKKARFKCVEILEDEE